MEREQVEPLLIKCSINWPCVYIDFNKVRHQFERVVNRGFGRNYLIRCVVAWEQTTSPFVVGIAGPDWLTLYSV